MKSIPSRAENSFSRDLRLRDAVAIVVGCIIGAGIFRVPGSIAQYLNHPLPILFTWLLGGLLSVAGALCYAELASMFPRTGGDYVYLRETFGNVVGFLFGWTKLFVERTGTIAIIAFVFAEYCVYLFSFPKEWGRFLAIGAIAGLTAVNVVGLKYGKMVQNLFTTLKVLALLSIIGLGLFFLPREISAGHINSLDQGTSLAPLALIQAVGMSLVYVLWTYGGWTEAAYVAEEIQEPEKNVPRAILGGVVLVILLYFSINLIYYLYIPAAEMRETKLVASAVVSKLVGDWGGKLVACFVAVSTFGALNGYILTGGRILYALSEDHPLFARFSKIHPRFHTPVQALIFNGICSVVLIFTKTFEQLMEYTTIAIAIFFALTGMCVFVLRVKRPDLPRPYKVWGYPWIPAAFVASTLLFVVNALVKEPKESFFGILLTLFGFVLFFISSRMKGVENTCAFKKLENSPRNE